MKTHTNVVETKSKFIDNLQEGTEVNVQLLEQTHLGTIDNARKNDILSQNIPLVILIKFYGKLPDGPNIWVHKDIFGVHNKVSFTNSLCMECLTSVLRKDANRAAEGIGTTGSFYPIGLKL